MSILYAGPEEWGALWRERVLAIDPTLSFHLWPESGDVTTVKLLVLAQFFPMDVAQFPNLRAIQSTWAGVDKLLPHMPAHLPLARMVDEGLARNMGEFVLYHALDCLRHGPLLREQQHHGIWKKPPYREASALTVGLMGYGAMGQEAARRLRQAGFAPVAWSRRLKGEDELGVRHYAGDTGLADFLAAADIVVCLLPLTRATRGILNQRLFAGMKRGAWLIHAGRGGHLAEGDLLAGLREARPGYAVLDVFTEEPLPPSHPFWTHPRIFISPHAAAITPPGAGAGLIVENYYRALAGQKLLYEVDRAQEY
ncbi:MAG TPA: glyoxylate/hydroxypyruvate reductase A [Dongiaceae bacterium]|jgi:glyoxylate/hydroxypyruvate reductase A|nr:glyoxylate/hydroxypyruvate reductase A [Dongiaceae bacterium]